MKKRYTNWSPQHSKINSVALAQKWWKKQKRKKFKKVKIHHQEIAKKNICTRKKVKCIKKITTITTTTKSIKKFSCTHNTSTRFSLFFWPPPPDPKYKQCDPALMQLRNYSVFYFSLFWTPYFSITEMWSLIRIKKTRENKTLTEMNIKSCVFLYEVFIKFFPNVSNLLDYACRAAQNSNFFFFK